VFCDVAVDRVEIMAIISKTGASAWLKEAGKES
jgi:hypothetical protein